MNMRDECGKCNGKLKQNSLQCSGLCKREFHPECFKLTNDDSTLIRKNSNIKWFCDCCILYIDSTVESKKAMENFMNEITNKLNNINNTESTPNKDSISTNEKHRSFAEVAGEVIVIKPKAKQECRATKDVIRKALNPAKLEVGITQIKDTRDGGVLIKCKSREEIEKIKNAAEKKLKKGYDIRMPEQRNPQVKIVDLEESMEKEVLEEVIKKQNSVLNHENAELHIKIIKKMKSRYMAIAECDPLTSKKILNTGKLSIGWSICRVFEYIPVFRCFRCGDYDHRASDCRNEERCFKCASRNHKTDQCESEHNNCSNCMASNDKLKLNLKTDHSVFDANCPVLLRKIETLKRNIKVVAENSNT